MRTLTSKTSTLFLAPVLFALLPALLASQAYGNHNELQIPKSNEQLIKKLQRDLCAVPASEKLAGPTKTSDAGCVACDVKSAFAATMLKDVKQNTGPLATVLDAALEKARARREVEYFESQNSSSLENDPAAIKAQIDAYKNGLEQNKKYAEQLKEQINDYRKLVDTIEKLRTKPSEVSSERKGALRDFLIKTGVNTEGTLKLYADQIDSYKKGIETYGNSEDYKVQLLTWKKQLAVMEKSYEIKKGAVGSVRQYLDWHESPDTRPFPSTEAFTAAKNWIESSIEEMEVSSPDLEAQSAYTLTAIAGLEAKLKALEENKKLESAPSNPSEEDIAKLHAKFDQTYKNTGTRDNPGFQTCGMSPAEIHALMNYTGNGYQTLNRALRMSGNTREQARAFEEVLNSALAKLRPYQGVVKRGANLPEAVLKQHKVGDIVTYSAFTSTSIESGFGADHRFTIKSKTGKYIAPFSNSYGEQEVLFQSNTKFRILSREEKNGGIEFVMEEVAD